MTAGADHTEASAGRGRPLVPRTSPAVPSAAVLLLHGGRADGLERPSPLGLAALRMRPFAAAITRATRGRDVLVAEVRYRHRGWNGDRRDAARDAEAALARLRERAGEVPVVLVGHSMGGRAALSAAADPLVRGVVALAPWCPPGEPVDHLAGRRLFLLHDERDRITSAAESWVFVRRARLAGADAVGIPMASGGHAMLRGAGAWHRRAAELAAGLLMSG
ncbi:alpha/beta hydrolase [Streptomyces sp. NBC_01216]|uniref:alpha/beta hydrolase n=1 Tax=unclassified Streptomyces TaxID=2593676 RepID=UPI002E0E26C3|nr:alpha/beta hydrolase [Streptomyces sp. NBC_01216]